ncbi:MAG: mechanosensitive ion channel family protein, partial [Pseudomonadota bacterium]
MTFDFDKLWATVLQVWNDGLFGVDIGRILVALAIFIGFLIVRKYFATRVVRRLERWAEKSET